MEKIHKIIIVVLGGILAVIMVAGIIVSVTRRDDNSSNIKYEIDENSSATVTTTTTNEDKAVSSSTTSDNVVTDNSQIDTSHSENDAPNGELTLSAKDMNILVGKTSAVDYEFSGEGTLTFASSNKGIATVDAKGNVEGVEIGSCKVSIKTENGEKVYITVTVTDKYGTVAVSKKTVYSVGCNFREGPGLDYNVISYLDADTEVTIIGESGDWYKVKVGNLKGFVGKSVVSDEPTLENNNNNSSSSSNNSSSSTSVSSSSKVDSSSSKVTNSSSKADSSSSKADSSSVSNSSSTSNNSSSVPDSSSQPDESSSTTDSSEASDDSSVTDDSSEDDSSSTPDFIIGGI